jgi:hypothetical protein
MTICRTVGMDERVRKSRLGAVRPLRQSALAYGSQKTRASGSCTDGRRQEDAPSDHRRHYGETGGAGTIQRGRVSVPPFWALVTIVPQRFSRTAAPTLVDCRSGGPLKKGRETEGHHRASVPRRVWGVRPGGRGADGVWVIGFPPTGHTPCAGSVRPSESHHRFV